jgi:ureidoglycolate lyase
MRTVQHRDLSLEAFSLYGVYSDMVRPSGPSFSGPGFSFYRDMARLHLGQETLVAFSVCSVGKREPIVDFLEYHNGCGELMMPLDGEVLVQVAPATSRSEPPLDQLEVFRVPAGTMVVLHAGVWHHAPYVHECERVNILVALPERTYAKDAVVVEIGPSERLLVK